MTLPSPLGCMLPVGWSVDLPVRHNQNSTQVTFPSVLLMIIWHAYECPHLDKEKWHMMTSNNVTLLVKGDLGCSGGEEHVFSTIPPCPSSHMRCGFRVRARTKSPRKVFSGARQAPLILESFFYLHAHVSMDTRDWHWMSSLITLHLKKFHSIFFYLCTGSWVHRCLYVSECMHMCLCKWICLCICGGQKRVTPSELRLQACVGHMISYVYAGIWIQALKTVQKVLFFNF